MSTRPRLEARVSAQERRQINLDARIEELSEDMTASFRQLSEYFQKIENRFDQTQLDITSIKEDITEIKSTLATLNQSTVLLLTQVLERLPKNDKP